MSEQNNIGNNKRLAKNTFVLYIRTGIVMIVSLYLSRILLQELGIDDFGIYNVVGSIVVLFSFLNNAMVSASQRFLTYELGKGNLDEVNKTFCASFWSQVLFAFILFIIVEILGCWFLNYQLKIPIERMNAANWAFQFSIITFCINMFRVPYDATVIANEKMSFYAYVSIVDAFLKLSIVLVLKTIDFDKLITYAFLLFIEAFLMYIVYVLYCIKKFSTCKVHLIKEKDIYINLLSFSGWSIGSGATNIATQKGFVFLLNIFYGVAVNAAFGVANQVNAAVTSFVGGFQTSYRPQIVKAYANQEYDHMKDMLLMTSKLSYALMIIPTLFLIFNMPLILELWLGKVPYYAVEFCQVILICTTIDAISGPFNAAVIATGNIKKYQILISLSFLMDLLLSFLLIKFGLPPYFVLISRICTRGIINAIISVCFVKKYINFNVNNYLKLCLVPILVSCMVPSVISFFLYHYYTGWVMFLFSIPVVVGLTGILLYFVLLSESERMTLKYAVLNKFSNAK